MSIDHPPVGTNPEKSKEKEAATKALVETIVSLKQLATEWEDYFDRAMVPDPTLLPLRNETRNYQRIYDRATGEAGTNEKPEDNVFGRLADILDLEKAAQIAENTAAHQNVIGPITQGFERNEHLVTLLRSINSTGGERIFAGDPLAIAQHLRYLSDRLMQKIRVRAELSGANASLMQLIDEGSRQLRSTHKLAGSEPRVQELIAIAENLERNVAAFKENVVVPDEKKFIPRKETYNFFSVKDGNEAQAFPFSEPAFGDSEGMMPRQLTVSKRQVGDTFKYEGREWKVTQNELVDGSLVTSRKYTFEAVPLTEDPIYG